MKRTARARLLMLGSLLSGVAALGACGDDSGGETPRGDASTFDAATPDASTSIDGSALGDARGPTDASGDPLDARPYIPDAAPGTPPSAAFTLSDTQGSQTLWVKATSAAIGGATPIVETLYDFGEGAGFAAAATHRYSTPGSFTVTQQVRDQAGLVVTSSSATVTLAAFTPVRFSQTDHSPVMRVSPDGTQVENRTGLGVARTDGSIKPGSGVFYFESEVIEAVRQGGFGVATAAAPLDQATGGSAQSLGLEATFDLRATGSTCTGAPKLDSRYRRTGWVIDYRGSSPIVHFVQTKDDGIAVVVSCTTTITDPLYAAYWSVRNTVGYEGTINTGWDTVNNPFTYGLDAVKGALTAAGHADLAAVLVPGFGATRAGRLNQPPALELPAPITAPLGQAITLSGSALDVEDGDLGSRIAWVDLASPWHARVGGTGASFTFTPNSIGRHPVTATVVDLDGGTTTKTVMVVVTGTLPQPNPVQLTVDATTGEGVTVTPDGLGATFAGTGKDGVKANQGIYGDFWYFEVKRVNPVRNMGHGLMVGEGSLNPYSFEDVPWSVSVNTFQGVWRELIPYDGYTSSDSDTFFGWAVDYRGEHPQVYVLVHGTVLSRFDLTEVWTPLYPIVYGNVAYPPLAGPDMIVNFGATPFAFDAKAILTTAGIDVTGMKLGWGVHAH